MRDLIECFKDWLDSSRSDANAHTLLSALTQETLKRCESADPAQREFDAHELAQAAGLPDCDDFEASKQKVERAGLAKYFEARTARAEEYFRGRGLSQGLRPAKRSTGGKHRAQWYLEAYELPSSAPAVPASIDEPDDRVPSTDVVRYDFAPPGSVKPAWWAQPLFSAGSAVTRSPRGVLWAALFFFGIAEILLCLFLLWVFSLLHRSIQTSDLVQVIGLTGYAWLTWRYHLEPLIRLLDDRMIVAGEFWAGMNEKPAQLELAKEGDRKVIRLVRYTAVCPICAGTIELRYAQGANTRRIVGCCDEAPHDHVYSFDRVSREGKHL
jgi:hypothetical protein